MRVHNGGGINGGGGVIMGVRVRIIMRGVTYERRVGGSSRRGHLQSIHEGYRGQRPSAMGGGREGVMC